MYVCIRRSVMIFIVTAMLMSVIGCEQTVTVEDNSGVYLEITSDSVAPDDHLTLTVVNNSDESISVSCYTYNIKRYSRGVWAQPVLSVGFPQIIVTIEPNQQWSQPAFIPDQGEVFPVHVPDRAGRYKVIKEYWCSQGTNHQLTAEFEVTSNRWDWTEIETSSNPDLEMEVDTVGLRGEQFAVTLTNNGTEPITVAHGVYLFRRVLGMWLFMPQDIVFRVAENTLDPGEWTLRSSLMPEQKGTYRSAIIYSYGSQLAPPLYAATIEFRVETGHRPSVVSY